MSMWNVADHTAAPKKLQLNSGRILQASFSPDGSRFVSAGDDDIRIWDASWGMEETQTALEEQQGIILSISLSPGGKFIVSGSLGGSICLRNLDTGELVKKLKLSNRVD